MSLVSFSPFRATRYVSSVDLIDVDALAAAGAPRA